MKADGTRRVRLTHNADRNVWDSDPTWSPDGTRIAFVRWGWGPDAEIYVMHADGTAVTRLTQERVDETDPAWQPVGAR